MNRAWGCLGHIIRGDPHRSCNETLHVDSHLPLSLPVAGREDLAILGNEKNDHLGEPLGANRQFRDRFRIRWNA